MKLETIVIGTGNEGDPFRCPLPTWVLVDIDYDRKTAIVEVPEGVYTGDKGFDIITVVDTMGKRHEVLVPSMTTLQLWEEIEAEKYPQFVKERRLRDVIRRGR
jgi:hypothetical protein